MLDRRGIDLRDHVEGTQVALVGWRVGLDRAHDDALVQALEQIADRRVVAERFDPDAEPGPDDLLTGDELLSDLVGEIARNRETETAVQPVDEGVHADHLAVDIAERSAAIAGVD